MKWNIWIGALAVSVGLCSQSFGFELLEQMLGLRHHGSCCQPTCCEPEPTCCEPEPSCCDPEPACCEPEPSCCEPEPSCCEPADCCASSCCSKRCGLFDGLHGLFDLTCNRCKKSSCCETSCCDPEPSCCEPEPSCCEPVSCCSKKRHCGGLLAGLFKHHNRCCKPASSCCSTASSCCGGGSVSYGGEGGTVHEADEAAPMPPAPMPDPSASLQRKGFVIPTSGRVARHR